MSITRLTGYVGEAEVLGKLRRISYLNEALLIAGMSMEEAADALTKLATGSTALISVQSGQVTIGMGKTQTVDPKAVLENPTASNVLQPAESNPKKTVKEVNSSTIATSPSTQTAENPKSPASTLPEEVRGATRIKDVLVYLETRGVKGLEALTAECLRMKPMIPLFVRITNLEARIARAYELMASESEQSK